MKWQRYAVVRDPYDHTPYQLLCTDMHMEWDDWFIHVNNYAHELRTIAERALVTDFDIEAPEWHLIEDMELADEREVVIL